MAAFFSAQVSLSSTAVRAVESADFDREVIVSTGGVTSFQIGFTSTEADSGVVWSADMSMSKSAALLRFTLPADEEVWLKHPTGGSVIAFVFVTKAS